MECTINNKGEWIAWDVPSSCRIIKRVAAYRVSRVCASSGTLFKEARHRKKSDKMATKYRCMSLMDEDVV